MPPKKTVAPAPHRVLATGVAVSGLSRGPGGRLVAAGGFGGRGRGQVTLFDARTGEDLGNFGTERGTVCWYAESSCDGLVAAGFGDCTLRIWDPETNATRELARLGGIVASVAWSADGKYLFSGNCGDNTVRLWDVARGTAIAEHTTKKSATWFVAMSGDAKRAVSGAGDKLIHVFDPMHGRELATLSGHTGKINGLTFFPDGSRVASASQDKSVRLWDLDAEKELFVIGGHTKQVTGVAVAPDQKQVASGSSDGTIRLWNVQTGADEGVISVGATGVDALTYSEDGSELFAGCVDATLRAFPVRRQIAADGDSLAALLALVWADPADDGPRAVVADFLGMRGDPRGEFITLQLERARGNTSAERRRRERELLALHQREWIGPIAPLVESTYVTFERGFIAGCMLKAVVEKREPKRHPAWSTIRTFIEQEGCPKSLVAHLLTLGADRKST